MATRQEVEGIVRSVAGRYNFRDPDLLVATVNQESGFNPRAVGDSGNSRGIFQENIRGRGAGLQPEQSFDPYASTERAIKEFNATYRAGLSRGQWAAAAQRPYDAAGYARSIDSFLSSPGRTSTDLISTSNSKAEPWAQDLLASAGTTPTPTPSLNASRGSEPWADDLLRVAGSDRSVNSTPGYEGPPQTDEIWPVAGQRWGAVNNPFGGAQARAAGTSVPLPAVNVGADLTGRYGTDVVAPVSGTVVEVFDAPNETDRNLNHGWGGMTLLRGDNGFMYRLSHARPGSIGARPGQRVGAGQYLQQIGTSGNTTGAHLDYEKFDRPGHFVDPVAAAGRAVGSAIGGAVSGAAQTTGAWVDDLLRSAGAR